MLSEETNTNERRRSLTFAEKFEVKFFFKAEAPREVAFCETSFTTGSECYYGDDDYWDQEDSYDEDDYYYDENQEEYEDYYGYNGYEGYEANEYDDYYQYGCDYYPDNVNFSIHYEMDRSGHHYNDYDDSEEEIRGRGCRELFGGFREEETNEEKASEKSNTRRLALAKLEKGLFRRQQLRDSESYSETEESEASNSNSESDPFDEPLPPTTGKDFLNDLKRTNSPVTIKATFTTRDMPISIPISNHNAYKVRGHEITQNFDTLKKRLPLSSEVKSSSLTIIDGDENPFSSLDDTLLSCTPLTLINKTPLVVNITTTDAEPVKDLLKSSSLSSKTSSTNKTNSFDVTYIPSLNSNDLVKTISSNNLLPNSSKKTNITNLLSSIHNNTNSKGGGKKKRMRSYSSPSSLQQLLPCY